MNKSSSKILKILLAVALVVVLTGSGAFLHAKSKPGRIQQRADAYFKSGELDKARIEYMNLLKASPMNVIAIQQL